MEGRTLMNKEIKSLLLCLVAFLAGMLVVYMMGCNDTPTPYDPVQHNGPVLDPAVLNAPRCPNPFCDCGLIAWTDIWCDYHAESIKKYGWTPGDHGYPSHTAYHAEAVFSPK